MRVLPLLTLITILTKADVHAQTCTQILNSAREKFSTGQFYEIPSLLETCLLEGFNKDQRIEAYWLLTRTHLFLDDPQQAENAYLNLLKQDPLYSVDQESDPIEMVYLSERYKTDPIFLFYARGGANLTNVTVIHNYGIDNTARTNEKYENTLGITAGLGVEINISDYLSVGLEANFFTRGYTYSNTFFNGDQQALIERQAGGELPMFIKARWERKNIQPYLYIGSGLSYLLNAVASVKLVDKIRTSADNFTETPVTGPELNILEQRVKFGHFGLFGLGVNFPIGYNYVGVDARYVLGLSNITNEENQYGNKELLFKYAYLDDDKRLNAYIVSLKFIMPLYKPRRIR